MAKRLKPLTTKDLCDRVSNNLGITKSDSRIIVNAFLMELTNSLVKGHKVLLSNYLTFTVTKRKGRVMHDVMSGENIEVTSSKTIKVQPSIRVKRELNEDREKIENKKENDLSV
jgi:nucleoid DNA-binding protein